MSEKTGYIPKDQRKKILFLADDMRVTSGVGTMAREIIEGTAHRFNWVQVGAAMSHPEAGKMVDLSDAVNNELGMTDASVKIVPYNGYGDSRLIRQLLEIEKPDAVLHFTDPRYWIWLYQIEHEIRQKIPMFFYAIWDDLPYPYYNENFYRSDDWIGCISKQTYNIVKHVSRKEPREPWSLTYVPHGINTKRFGPLPADDTEMLEVRERLFGGKEVDYVVFYNSRNIRRKMTSDILLAFDTFMKTLPEEKRKKCRLVMHTQKVDEHGTDLPVVIRDVVPGIEPYVVFSDERIESKHINILYNIADVTINLSSNEGFGLGTCESMIAGTPIIVNVTGGLQDQCGFVNHDGEYLDPERDFTYEWGSNHDGRFLKHGDWAFPVFPVSRSLQGSPMTPYIFDDRASWNDAANRLMEVYLLGREERKRRGLLGRAYALGPGQFTAERMCELFIQDMERAWENWTPRKPFTLVSVK
jgi:glycosyltransferase involved in cell wall biosynthesis